ncbi:helix-turn-helix transcriptional regulator [Actinomyces oris]|uniref:LuxR C-terminal-related transcriptional regulator n=1 Tax=Actinomyces oris TaxID=544580 RepID=A0AAW8L8T0_9ACTO|nr:LuxR C-terminal-related transcriptional regulator [Actinomyces oris]MDR0178032.1 LuxR C-terminal-related transcriptional regulator [Actinomyces oris]
MPHLITTSPEALSPNLIPIQPPVSRSVSRTAQRELDEVAARILPAGRSHLASILTGSGHTALGMDGRAVVLLDPVLLDRSSPVENIREINRRNVPVVAYSETLDDRVISEILAEDVMAFVRMSAPRGELAQAICDALSGMPHESLGRMKVLLRYGSEKAESLVPTELKVYERYSRGYTKAAIARDLNVSLNTVSTYLTRIREKLKASDSEE